MLQQNRKDWSDKLDDALWAFRTAYKAPIRSTPFRMIYGKTCHLPVEVQHKAYWEIKSCNFDQGQIRGNRMMQINFLDEHRNDVYHNSWIYKEKTKQWHDKRLRGNKNFEAGDQVLLYNSILVYFQEN